MTQPRIDAEQLAALLDGRLSGDQRAELLQRLAASDSATDAFADAAAVTNELQPLPSKTFPASRWIAIAAALTGLALAPWLWTRVRQPQSDGAARLVSLLGVPVVATPPQGWDASPWSSVRGDDQPLTPSARALRIGAHMTDLELAARRGDTAAARFATDIAALLEGVPAAGPVIAMYRQIAEQAATSPSQLDPMIAKAETAAAGLAGADLVRLGAWAQAARLAAHVKDAAFFQSREPRTTLADDRAIAGLSQPGRTALALVQTTLAAEGAPDWGALERGLTELLRSP